MGLSRADQFSELKKLKLISCTRQHHDHMDPNHLIASSMMAADFGKVGITVSPTSVLVCASAVCSVPASRPAVCQCALSGYQR